MKGLAEVATPIDASQPWSKSLENVTNPLTSQQGSQQIVLPALTGSPAGRKRGLHSMPLTL